MDLTRIVELIDGICLTSRPIDGLVVIQACSGDLMSDVLRFARGDCLLLTGLANVHAVRTAEMSGIGTIVFVCGKQPAPEVIDEASRIGINLISTDMAMFEASGVLYSSGVSAVGKQNNEV